MFICLGFILPCIVDKHDVAGLILPAMGQKNQCRFGLISTGCAVEADVTMEVAGSEDK
jgi:hypothetical protein